MSRGTKGYTDTKGNKGDKGTKGDDTNNNCLTFIIVILCALVIVTFY